MKRRVFTQAVAAGGLVAAAPLTSQAVAAPNAGVLEVRRAADRGVAEHGWLSSRHSFSFANYYDPDQVGFSDLLVINEDRVAPGRGFGKHPHRDMEIFSYVLEGRLEHKDSLGNGSFIEEGDVQIMSAGTGVQHSEFNPSQSDGVHFLQIWLTPSQRGLAPQYQQQKVTAAQKQGQLKLILSPDKAAGSLEIRQDARVYAGRFTGKESATLKLAERRHAYVHVARGSVEVNGQKLAAGDGARIRNARQVTVRNGSDAEVLVFDMRPGEVPAFG